MNLELAEMTRMRIRDEGGATSLVQTVLVAPAILFTLMLIVQFGLLFHAKNIAEQAAQEGAAEARAFNGSKAAARESTLEFLDSLGPRMLTNRSVVVDRTAQTATVTVQGTVLALVPGVNLGVRETASAPRERYVPVAQR